MELNYKVFGEGQPVIILHGLFGSLDNWQTIGKELADEYQVYIVDQRNHGKSPHTPDHSFELMADDLHDFIRQHGIDHPHVIGHSMGGKTAMHYAVKYPDEIGKLVVVDIAPKAYKPHHEAIFKALFELDLQHIGSRNDADEMMSKSIGEKAVRQFLLKNLTRNDAGDFEWKFNLKALHENYDQINQGLEVKEPVDVETLIIRGEDSNYVKDEDREGFEALFENVQMATIKGAGHWVHAEAPQVFLEVVKHFL